MSLAVARQCLHKSQGLFYFSCFPDSEKVGCVQEIGRGHQKSDPKSPKKYSTLHNIMLALKAGVMKKEQGG